MTITTTTSRWEAVGNGSTTVFPYNNKIFADTDLKVYLDGVLQTLTTHYTVSGAGTDAGGNVTFLTAPADGVSVVVVRAVPNTQLIDYPAAGLFPSIATEDGLDKRTIISQQNNALFQRAIRYLESDSNAPSAELPTLNSLKGKFLKFDDSTGAPTATAVAPSSTSQTIWKSPYDYGATPGEELTANNKPYIDALMDAAKASWDSTYKTYTVMPTGLGKMWNCPGGTRMNGVRQKGMIIRDFQLYLSGSGAIGFDVAGSAWVTLENCHVEGDLTSEPAVGFLYGLDSSLDIASRIALYNCSTVGPFSKAGRVNLASETSLEVGCRWWNNSRLLTAYASAAVDNVGALDDNMGGLTSPNTTLPTAADGHKSFVLHDWGTTQHIRYSRVNLTVTGITKANPAVVTVTTGTLASSGLANGDKIIFYPIGGMTELRHTVFTVANISGDTFELSGVDSTGYTTFTSGTVRNQTGPSMLLAGIRDLRNGPFYALSYGSPPIVVDTAQSGAPPPTSVHLQIQSEVDPIHIVRIDQGTNNPTFIDWNVDILGAAHPPGDAIYDDTGSGSLIFHRGRTHVDLMGQAPASGIFKNPGKVSLWMHGISVPLAAALNAPSSYVLYRVKEWAADRAPDRLRDYEQPRWYGIPEFIQEATGSIAARVRLAEDGALSGPFFDLIRDSASPAASDILARIRWMGQDSGGNDTEYGGIAGRILDPTDASEDGQLQFYAAAAGALTVVGTAQPDGLFSHGFLVQTIEPATTSELEDVSDPINTARKYPGKQVFNTTTGKPVYAVAGNAAAVWNDATGTTAHTPV